MFEYILPYMEQQQIYNNINFMSQSGYASTFHTTIFQTKIAGYLCPSERRGRQGRSYGQGRGGTGAGRDQPAAGAGRHH